MRALPIPAAIVVTLARGTGALVKAIKTIKTT
jgi:hypothetical protein